MLGLTPIGILHTAISLVALTSGGIALVRDKQIRVTNRIGRMYVVTTVLTCLTGFAIFEHGGFGKPHVLGVLTLVVIAVAVAAAMWRWFGAAARYVEVVALSVTFFFHLIPGVTETVTRLPPGAPLVTDREGPALQLAAGLMFVGLLLGVTMQVRRLRGARAASLQAGHDVDAPPANRSSPVR